MTKKSINISGSKKKLKKNKILFIFFLLLKIMELTNSNDENSFDPTPKLKSSRTCRSSSFKDERICSYCENEYSETLLFEKKYCKICLSGYIKDNDDNVYLDVHI